MEKNTKEVKDDTQPKPDIPKKEPPKENTKEVITRLLNNCVVASWVQKIGIGTLNIGDEAERILKIGLKSTTLQTPIAFMSPDCVMALGINTQVQNDIKGTKIDLCRLREILALLPKDVEGTLITHTKADMPAFIELNKKDDSTNNATIVIAPKVGN